MTSSQRIRRTLTTIVVSLFALSALAFVVVPLTYHDI